MVDRTLKSKKYLLKLIPGSRKDREAGKKRPGLFYSDAVTDMNSH